MLLRRIRHGLVIILISVCSVVFGTMAGMIIGFWQQVPLPGELQVDNLLQTTRICDVHGGYLASIYIENREIVSLDRVPRYVRAAFVAMEDTRFYKHHGFDVKGIIRAAWVNLRHGKIVQGGSTITQQVARNFYLNDKRTYSRKLREIILAVKLERHYTKDEILQAYLNQIYFGAGAYGIAVASHIYFRKEPSELNLAEGAMLAGLVKAPSKYSPWNDRRQCLLRQKIVLRRMRERGYITFHEADMASVSLPPLTAGKGMLRSRYAPYFVDYVLQELLRHYPSKQVYGGGLEVRTTLEPHIQRSAERSLARRLSGYGQELQGAVVVLSPDSGRILAMVGGRDYTKTQFNRVWQAHRQPGSAFKIFTYTEAIANGYSPLTILNDMPVSYRAGNRLWKPRNYSGTFSGQVTLRQALERSINVASVDLFNRLGMESVIARASEMGIESRLTPCISLALGSAEVTPLEMAAAYSALDNGGFRIHPTSIISVKGPHIAQAYASTSLIRESVLDPGVCYIMTDILRGVITRGTGRRASIGRPAAGKTGTSSDYRDAWFIGYTPGLLAAVWIGYDDNRPMGGLAGGSLPADIWRNTMNSVLRGSKIRQFKRPDDVIWVAICKDSGLKALSSCPGKAGDIMLTYAAPSSFCNLHGSGNVSPGTTVPAPSAGGGASPGNGSNAKSAHPGKPSGSKPVDTSPPETPSPGTAPPAPPPPPEGTTLGNPATGDTVSVSLFVCELSGKLPTSRCPVLTKKRFKVSSAPWEVCNLH